MDSTSLNNGNELFDYKGTQVSISDFKKEIVKLSKTSIEDALNSVSEFTNKNWLTFPSIARILKALIPMMYKTKKFSEDELKDYVFSFKEVYNNQYNAESVPQIANILNRFSSTQTIDFLENSLLYFEEIKVDRLSLFEITIALSDTYYKINDYEKAFKTLNRATFFVNIPTDQFDYLWKLKIINEKSAEICFNENNPKYGFYLNYKLIAFAFDIARDLTAFPHIYPFYFRKKSQYSLEDDDSIYLALEKLNILKYRKSIFIEYNNFIYNEFPIIYGIPIKYSEDSVRKIFDNMATNYDEFSALMEFSEKINKKSLDIISYKTNEFVSGLLKRYYDLGNK